MCWPHVHRNVVPQLKSIKTISAKLGNEILADIVSMQSSVLNEATFRKVYSQMEEKYKNLDKCNNNTNLLALVTTFFDYFRATWVDSAEFAWYEGSNPWGVSNNQGVEGKNKAWADPRGVNTFFEPENHQNF